MPRITPNLWFDTESEEAAAFYVSVLPNAMFAMKKIGVAALYAAAHQR